MAAALIAFAWLLGVVIAAFTDGDLTALVVASSLFAAATFAWRTRRRRRTSEAVRRRLTRDVGTLVVIAIGVATVFLAGWRYDAASTPDLSLTRFNQPPQGEPPAQPREDASDLQTVEPTPSATPTTLRAVISEEPEERETTTLYRLDVREVSEDGAWHEQAGSVLMRGPIAPRFEYGDLLEVEAKLEMPPTFPDFDYRNYLASRGIASLVSFPKANVIDHGHGDWLRAQMIDVRERLSRALSDVLPEPHASLAAGILYGERSSIPNDLRDDMRATGTSHLVAVSGQNVTIVAAMVIAVLAWVIGRRPAAWFSLAAIAGYTLLVGAQPSVIRAAIMGAVYVLATISGRQQTSVIALIFAAAFITAFDPRVVDDISFQLSFAATLGLATLLGPLRERLQSRANMHPAIVEFPLTRPAIEMFSVTVTAVLFTLPIAAVNFGQISLAAPVANLFVVPAFLAVGLTAGIAAAIDIAAPSLAPLASWIAWPAAEYMIEAIRLFARVPGASVTLHGITRWHAVAFYAVLFGSTWWLIAKPSTVVEPPPKPKPSPRRVLVPIGGIALLTLLVAALIGLVLSQPERGRLSVTFLDVGQGDAILIEGPHRHRVLIDGGPGSLPITRALSRNMPFDDRRIDLVILTHAQSDHMAGLVTVLERYDVGGVIDTALPGNTGLYDVWEATLHSSGAAVTTANRGQTIDLGDGAMLQVVSPDQNDPLLQAVDLNTASTVVRLTMGEASFLLTGDLDAPGEQTLVRSGTNLQSTVLKVGHHGSTTSSSPAFVSRVQPAIDVIEVGAANSFGHPSQEVLNRLSGDLVLRTDQDGDVTVSTDGTQIWVER